LRIFFNKSRVSGFETSGDFGPPPSPSRGPHGTGATGLSVRSGMGKITDGYQHLQTARGLPPKRADAKLAR
jgi:hypothetical protein